MELNYIVIQFLNIIESTILKTGEYLVRQLARQLKDLQSITLIIKYMYPNSSKQIHSHKKFNIQTYYHTNKQDTQDTHNDLKDIL